jgi:hypothetical protein
MRCTPGMPTQCRVDRSDQRLTGHILCLRLRRYSTTMLATRRRSTGLRPAPIEPEPFTLRFDLNVPTGRSPSNEPVGEPGDQSNENG